MTLSLRHGSFFFVLLVFMLLPFAHAKVLFFGFPLYFPEIAILLALFFFLFAHRKKNRTAEPLPFFPDRWVIFGSIFFLGGALLSFFSNPFSLTGLGMLKSWFFFPFVFGFLLWHHTRELRVRECILFIWLCVLLGVALRSLLFFAFGELTYDGRLAGDYPSPNFLALFMAPAPLLLFYFFLFSTGVNSIPRLLRTFLYGTGLALVLLVLFATHSYGAWLGIGGATFVFCLGKIYRGTLLVSWKKYLLVTFIFLVSVVGIFVLEREGSKWHSLVTQDSRSSLASRFMIWRAATQIAIDHPFFGIGVGRFQNMYLTYQRHFPPYLEWAVPEPHNLLLAIFFATGVLGLCGFLIMCGRLILLLLRNFFRCAEEKERNFSLLMLSLWTLFLIYGLTDTPYFNNDLALLFFLMVALSLSHKSQKEKTLSEERV